MAAEVGKTVPMSRGRRLVCDFLRHSQRVPSVAIARTMDVCDVALARQKARPRPSWCAILTKAYAFVAAAIPELRRAYLPFPWPRFYEHPENVACIVVERQLDDEAALFLVPLLTPEKQSLLALDEHLHRYKDAPLDSIGVYRQQIRLASLPWPLRPLVWWQGLCVSGRRRARHLGTFGVTSVASTGTDDIRPLSPWTTLLHYDPIRPDGTMYVRLTFDHRVLDGMLAARVLAEMEVALRGPLLNELGYLHALDAA